MLRGMRELKTEEAKIAILASVRASVEERVKEVLQHSPSFRPVEGRAPTAGTNSRTTLSKVRIHGSTPLREAKLSGRGSDLAVQNGTVERNAQERPRPRPQAGPSEGSRTAPHLEPRGHHCLCLKVSTRCRYWFFGLAGQFHYSSGT